MKKNTKSIEAVVNQTSLSDMLSKLAIREVSKTSDVVKKIRDIEKHPCDSCSALCCRILLLERFSLSHYRDLDKVKYYLNFPNLEVMISADYRISVYFSGFCSFLETLRCKVHNKPEQPNLCVHYSPYKCFYKKADVDKQHIIYGKLWLNRERLEFLEQELYVNSQLEIVSGPSADVLAQQLDRIPYTEFHESVSIQGKTEPVALKPPCVDCNGLCCSSLLFPGKAPETIQDLDFIRYALGYPEVEYVITPNDWVMKVNVRCRYLDTNNRCSIYERPERPLYCRYLNPHKCTIKPMIIRSCLNIGLEQFNRIDKHLVVNNNGGLEEIPPLSLLKKVAEES